MENKEKNPLNEAALKAKCVDFLLSAHTGPMDDYVLVNELPFADGKRRADIVELNDSMNVFEIKSDLDSLDRLQEQIYDYKSCFDTVTIVTTEKHLHTIRSRRLLSEGIGLLLVRGDEIVRIRKATPYRRFNKYALASFMHTKDLNNLIKSLGVVGFSNMTITQRRQHISQVLPKDELRGHAINSLKQVHKKSSDDFLNSKKRKTLLDKIRLFWRGLIGRWLLF